MAKKIKLSIKKFFASLLNLLGLTSLISCGSGGWLELPWIGNGPYIAMYGMPANYKQISGVIKGDLDGDESTLETVKGISVSIEGLEEPSAVSTEDGSYWLDFFEKTEIPEKVILLVKDTDGEENGSFEDQRLELDFGEDKYITEDIVLVKKIEK